MMLDVWGRPVGYSYTMTNELRELPFQGYSYVIWK